MTGSVPKFPEHCGKFYYYFYMACFKKNIYSSIIMSPNNTGSEGDVAYRHRVAFVFNTIKIILE